MANRHSFKSDVSFLEIQPAVETAPTIAKHVLSLPRGRDIPKGLPKDRPSATRNPTDEGRFRKGCREFIRRRLESSEQCSH